MGASHNDISGLTFVRHLNSTSGSRRGILRPTIRAISGFSASHSVVRRAADQLVHPRFILERTK